MHIIHHLLYTNLLHFVSMNLLVKNLIYNLLTQKIHYYYHKYNLFWFLFIFSNKRHINFINMHIDDHQLLSNFLLIITTNHQVSFNNFILNFIIKYLLYFILYFINLILYYLIIIYLVLFFCFLSKILIFFNLF